MSERPMFAVLRGDRRAELLCDGLISDGFSCQLLSSTDRWKQENLPPPGTVLLLPREDAAVSRRAEEHGFSVYLYGRDRQFQAENGIITAECAIQVAMRHRERILRESSALVVGYGNIGRPLYAMLKDFGVETAVCVHRAEQLRPDLNGFSVDALPENAGAYDLIFNTAPQIVFTGEILSCLSKTATIIDLASSPGGVDRSAASEMEIRVVPALRLPGLLAPASAADAIRRTVHSAIQEGRL